MDRQDIALFACGASRWWGEQIGQRLGRQLNRLEEQEFDDGEHKSRPLDDPAGKHVYVVQSLYGDPRQTVHDKLCRLLFFLGACRDAGAATLTAVIPYLCYGRKDRRTKSCDPVTTKYVAQLLEAVGTDRIITLEAHNLAALENAFRIPVVHLETAAVFVEYLLPFLKGSPVVVVSPDIGGIKRSEQFRMALSERLGAPVTSAFMEKQRRDETVTGEGFFGEVGGRMAVIVDDLISSGTTLARAAQACHARGAQTVYAIATHGVFAAKATQILEEARFEKIVVTDTLEPFRLDPRFLHEKVTVLSAAGMFAQAIGRLQEAR